MPYFSWFRTWRIIPDSKRFGSPPFISHLGRLERNNPNQLLTGMILQVNGWDIVFASMCYFEHRTRARHDFFFGGVQAVKHKVVSTASFNQQRFQVPEMEKQITFGIQANPFFNATTN